MVLKKRFTLFFVFSIFVFLLLLSKPCLAGPVYYSTNCDEKFSIGSCWSQCCLWEPLLSVCLSWCTACSCSGSWVEYHAETAECGSRILKRNCRSVGVPGSCTCRYGSCRAECEPPEICKECEGWQKAQRAECFSVEWGLVMPERKCEGSCIDQPGNDRYYNNPNFPTNMCSPEEGGVSADIYLPVKLDWDDVKGWWKSGWKEGGVCPKKCSKDCPEECFYPEKCYEELQCVKSYALRLEGEMRDCATGQEITQYQTLLDKSEFTQPCSCFFKSNRTYGWHVKACCGANGTNCGAESNWTFTTNLAPEPVSPHDPDWAGEGKGQNISVPATLDWCDVEEANSYVFRAYVLQAGQKICHPNLLATKGGQEFCEPWILRKQRRDMEQPEKTLFSDFLDPDLYFFTGDTSYFWEIATCVDDNGLECMDYSQQWGFTTAQKEVPKTFLVAPPHDPSGQKPVGLPLVLDWRKDEGVNSWRYKINSGQEFTNTSQSRSFDYPELSLNTFYQWQVLSCLDYQGKKCGNPWSEIYTFKTTGQPPNITYPSQGATGVVVPVNFNWEDVPGARSYVFKIQGDGLNLEKAVDKPEFSLDYPDLKMLVNYSWQVKTCAREEGGVCGSYSAPQDFQTFKLPAPQEPSPANEGALATDAKFVSWGSVPGAKGYQYQIKYLSLSEKETDETCQSLAGQEILEEPKAVLLNSDFAELNCLGDYRWQVRACLDESCEAVGEWANWTFALVEPAELSGFKGLIPCGQSYNNPDTPWNERESCQIKHLFLLMKVIIDFLLFRMVPLVLAMLTIISGLMFYFSFGKAATLAGVMSLWKSVIMGLLIIFFAWTMVNLFLKLAGYQIGIFGNWYEL